MKKNTKAIDIARPYFQGKSTHEKLHVTSDGQVFTQLHLAEAHTPRLTNKDIITVSKSEVISDSSNDNIELLDSKIKDLADSVNAIEDLSALEALKVAEKSGQNRKGALSIIDNRLAEVKALLNIEVAGAASISADEEE